MLKKGIGSCMIFGKVFFRNDFGDWWMSSSWDGGRMLSIFF